MPPDSRLAALLDDAALTRVLDALPGARIVGGAVRDALAGLPVSDIDVATPWTPDAVIAALEAGGLRAVPTGLDHGTVTAVCEHRGFEVTTLRRDVATDGRHAVVAFTDDWRADAARRDFTFNAMSMARDGTVFDAFGGRADLAAGRVRFVGDAAARVAEDRLRILRYFRFQARYGRGDPDPAALEAIRGGVTELAHLSVERVWSELARILAAPDPSGSVALMARLGVLAAVLPEGSDPARLAALTAAGGPPDPVLRLAALLTGDAEAAAARLRLSAAERHRLSGLRRGPVPRADDDDAALRRLLADEPPDMLIGRVWLAAGAAGAAGADDPRTRLRVMARPVFPLEGRDVVALGVPPGPAVGDLLRRVRAWWLAGGCAAGADDCRAELGRLMGTARIG